MVIHGRKLLDAIIGGFSVVVMVVAEQIGGQERCASHLDQNFFIFVQPSKNICHTICSHPSPAPTIALVTNICEIL